MMSFHADWVWVLVLVAVVPLVWWPEWSARRRTVLRHAATPMLSGAPASLRARCRWIVPLLRTLALALLIVAIARPQKGNEETRIFAEGIAIQLVVDRSGSMEALDFKVDGRPVNRLAAVKRVVRDFVQGTDETDARRDDLIGLIVFGTFADSLCPLTLDHDHLLHALSGVQVASQQSNEAGTAIGDAVALAIDNLRGLERRRQWDADHRIKSKIIILLTDGENTAGDIEPLQSADIATSFAIKVYTIGAGSEGLAPFPTRNLFGEVVMRPQQVPIDEDTLKEMAQRTGGQYFRARDTHSLEEIYRTIGELETSEIEEQRFTSYRELATAGFEWGGVRVPAILWMVWLLLATELLLSTTWLRRGP